MQAQKRAAYRSHHIPGPSMLQNTPVHHLMPAQASSPTNNTLRTMDRGNAPLGEAQQRFLAVSDTFRTSNQICPPKRLANERRPSKVRRTIMISRLSSHTSGKPAPPVNNARSRKIMVALGAAATVRADALVTC